MGLCRIGEPGLTVTMPTQGPDSGKLVLSGHTTVAYRSFIGMVRTANDGLTRGDVWRPENAFTLKFLRSAIPVVPGQIVQVKVIISSS